VKWQVVCLCSCQTRKILLARFQVLSLRQIRNIRDFHLTTEEFVFNVVGEMDDGPYDADMADSSLWYETAQYENTNKVSGKKSECDTQKDEDSHYETLHLEDLDKPKSKTEIQDKSLKRLKCVIYILIVLIIVLYVTLISVIMIMFLPKDSG
jgi:hypothetical protein